MKRYPIIGGPLDGKTANNKDFVSGYISPSGDYRRPPGEFVDFRDQYAAFNRADRWKKVPTMVFLYVGLLP